MTRARLTTIAAFAVASVTLGCTNFIREYPSTIWDAVDGTVAVEVDDLVVDGATVTCRLRYFCERQQFNVTEVVETLYSGIDELYEVPIGIPGTAVGLVWYILAEGVTLGSADDDVSTSILDWGAAGLNPILPVENGMFADRHSIRIKDKSPQEGSIREPYEAALRVVTDRATVRFAEPGGPPSDPIAITVEPAFQLKLNLLSAAAAMPSPSAQKVVVEIEGAWSEESPPESVTFDLFLDAQLANRLYQARTAVAELLANPSTATQATQQLNDLGFSREAASLRDRASQE